MVKKKQSNKAKRRRFLDLSTGFLVHLGKEASTIPAYGIRELTGQPQGRKSKCTLKKGWFE